MGVLDNLLRPAPPECAGTAAVAWIGFKIFCVGAAVIVGVPLLLCLTILILY